MSSDADNVGMARGLALFAIVFGVVVAGSWPNSRVQFFGRALISLTCLLFFSAYGSTVAILFWLLQRRGDINYVTARSYALVSAPLVGISFKVEGSEHLLHRPAIYVCNHQAAVDLLVLGKIFPRNCVIVGKQSLKLVPLLGIFMTLGGSIFLNRGNHSSAMRTFADAARDIKERKVSVFIFPEGTRGHLQEADLLPFKKGAFHLAAQAEIPIVPIVVANYSHIYDSRRRIFRGGELKIKVLPPIPTEGVNRDSKEDIDALTNKTRDAMLQTLKEISPHANGNIANGNVM